MFQLRLEVALNYSHSTLLARFYLTNPSQGSDTLSN